MPTGGDTQVSGLIHRWIGWDKDCLDESLRLMDGGLARIAHRHIQPVIRYFGGLSVEEVAESLSIH